MKEGPGLAGRPVAGVVAAGAVAAVIAGCAWSQRYEAERMDEAIAGYRQAAAKIQVGDSRAKVLALMEPMQFKLLSNETRPPLSFPIQSAGGETTYVDVFFFRSGRQPGEAVDSDAPPPDEDFTPYIFEHDVLTGIGWDAFIALRNREAPNPKFKPDKAPCPSIAGPLSGCF
jgi:hypothetical protein